MEYETLLTTPYGHIKGTVMLYDFETNIPRVMNTDNAYQILVIDRKTDPFVDKKLTDAECRWISLHKHALTKYKYYKFTEHRQNQLKKLYLSIENEDIESKTKIIEFSRCFLTHVDFEQKISREESDVLLSDAEDGSWFIRTCSINDASFYLPGMCMRVITTKAVRCISYKFEGCIRHELILFKLGYGYSCVKRTLSGIDINDIECDDSTFAPSFIDILNLYKNTGLIKIGYILVV